MTPVMHATSQELLENALKTVTHALLLTGKQGIGLSTVIHHYAHKADKTVITVLPEKDEKIDLEKGAITVERIRELYNTTKTIDKKGRIIVIDYAERMGLPAQNAFLKLLEEPTEGTVFVLLSHKPEVLLPTIRSRTQEIALRPVSREQSERLLDNLKVVDATKRTQLLFIAEGLPAELTRLVNDDTYFEARAAIVKDAREFITGAPYKRLLLAKQYKDSRQESLILLEDAMKQLRQTIANDQSGGQEGALKALGELEKLHKRITEQGNIRLQLSSAALLS